MSAVHYHLGAFPPPVLDWPVLLPLIGPANAALARYAGLIDAHGFSVYGFVDHETLLCDRQTALTFADDRQGGLPH